MDKGTSIPTSSRRGMEKKEEKMKTFGQYLEGLATTPICKLATRMDFAFLGTNLIPDELTDEFWQFCVEWRERFNERNTIRGIISSGWYNLTVKACEGVYDTYPDRLQTIVNVWGPQRVASIRASWEKNFPGHDADEAPVIARVELDRQFGPWIAEIAGSVTSPTPLGLVYLGSLCWRLEGKGFGVEITTLGSIPFLRAARLVEARHLNRWNAVILLEWIFAAGYDNALTAANDAISGRSSETMSAARRKIRAAIA